MNPEMQKLEAEPSERVRKVLDIAAQAGDILMRYFKQNVDVKFKNNDEFDPVTQADMEADRFLRVKIAEAFPGDHILSEENPEADQDFSGRVWMIDPLDGTKEFVAGRDGFAVMIGLWENGSLVLGVVNAPARGEIYYAEKGKGAFIEHEGKFSRIEVGNLVDLRQARLVVRHMNADMRPMDKIVENLPVRERITEASVGLKFGLIAEGKAETHVHTNNRAGKWDTAGPQIILEEAGGIVTDADGKPLDYTHEDIHWQRSFVASNNRQIHEAVIAAIAEGEGK